MKKLSMFVVLMLAVALMAGCSKKTPPAESVAPLPESSVASELPEEILPADPLPGLPPVMDAALYRGVVTDVSEVDGTTVVTLEQVTGTSYGAPNLKVSLGESTTTNLQDDNKVAVGNFVEVYYNGMGEATEDENLGFTAISMSLLPDADLSIFVGTLEEITVDEEGNPNIGDLLVKSLSSDNSILYHFDESTQFYLDKDSLEPGAKLVIYSNGATTRSIPAQGYALEVSPMAEAE